MALLLYLIVAGVTLFACRKSITPISRGAALVIVLLPFLFTGKALITNRVYGGYDILFLSAPFSDYAKDYGFTTGHNGFLLDHVLQMVPWQRQVRESFAQHRWPLWNPAMNSGEVLAAAMQAAPLSPINLIALLLPLDLATTFSASLVFFLAALFTFAFARELECSEGASLIAAAGYTLCSGMAFFGTWPHGRSWSVLPFILLAVRRVVRDRNERAAALLTTAFVLLIVSGHPETMLHVVTVAAIYGLFELIPIGREWLRPTMLAISAGIIALLLTAITLLPFIAALPWSFDYRVRQNPPLPATTHEISKAIRATFIPYYGGASWHTPTSEWDFGLARAGSVILALALIAFVRLLRRREARFFAVLCVIGLLAGWKAPPVDPFLRLLPLFKIALNDRLGFAAAFSMSLLAGMAFDARAARFDRRILLIAAALLAIASASLWRMQLMLGVDGKLLVAGAAAEILGLALLFAALGTHSPRTAAAIVILAIAAQRVVEDGNIHPTLPRRMFYPSVPLIAAVPREPLFRFTAIDNMVVPNVASMYGLDDVRGYSAMTFYPYVETMPLWSAQKRAYHDVADLSRPFLSFLGVRYAITPRTMDPPPGWRVVIDDRTSRLVENLHAIPRVFVPRRIRFTDSDDTTLKEMTVAADFTEEAWVRAEGPPKMIENGDAMLRVQRRGSRYDIDADARTATRIVVAEANWPGWRASINGARIPIEQANRAFLAIRIPPGHHRIHLIYLPDAYVYGRTISIATLVMLVLGAGVRISRRKKSLATAQAAG